MCAGWHQPTLWPCQPISFEWYFLIVIGFLKPRIKLSDLGRRRGRLFMILLTCVAILTFPFLLGRFSLRLYYTGIQLLAVQMLARLCGRPLTSPSVVPMTTTLLPRPHLLASTVACLSSCSSTSMSMNMSSCRVQPLPIHRAHSITRVVPTYLQRTFSSNTSTKKVATPTPEQ
jgi:hypothetical protein